MGNGNASIAGVLLEAGPDHVRAVEDSPELREVQGALAGAAPAIRWDAARERISAAVRDALEVKLDDLMLSTWVRSALLAKYLDSSKYPPDQSILAHLSEHTIKTTLRASIEVYVGEMPVMKIPMEVQLRLLLKGFILTIQGGKVLQIAAGTCQAEGKVTLAGVVLTEKALKPVELPDVIRLKDAKPIGQATT